MAQAFAYRYDSEERGGAKRYYMCFNHESGASVVSESETHRPVVSVLDGDTLGVLHLHQLNVSASAA